MNTFLPAVARSSASSLKIKGRVMLYEEFTDRVKEYCDELGFARVSIRKSSSCGELAGSGMDILPQSSARDTAIILSCRVSYNPNWGGYCGLPQQLVRGKNDDRGDEQCPAAFIAPFLRQYRFAQEHIYLTETGKGQHLITLPETLLKKDEEKHGSKLIVELDKVAEPDQGVYAPVMVSGSMHSYRLSDTLRQTLETRSFAWKPTRSIPIGRYLGSELFSFADIMQEVDRNSIFLPTLLPHLGRIVTHQTPHLHAAEIHLRQEFSRTIGTFIADNRACFGNILCLAGLDIDMSAFRSSREEHYFVPWKAYLETNGDDFGEKRVLDQDALFARLVSRD